MAKISVIIPTYNRPGFLVRALLSVAAQTFKDYEAIVVNDGGCPVSEECGLMGVPYIPLLNNGGLAHARNIGIKNTTSEWIAYLDDDDVWLPNHLETVYNALTNQDKCRAAYTDCYYWFDEHAFRLLLSEDYRYEKMKHHNLSPIINIMHHRSLFEQAGYFDESLPLHEDYDLWLRFIEHTDFIHIPTVTALYSKRRNSNQLSNNRVDMVATKQKVRMRYA